MSVAYTSLTSTEKATYRRQLGADSLIYSRIQMLDLDHNLVTSMNPVFIDGQVNYNNTDGVQRVLSIGFRDPAHTLRFDTTTPNGGMNGVNRLIRATQMVYVPGLSQWVATDVVTARPTTVERNGEIVTVEAQSKECLYLRNVPRFTIPKGTNVVAAIRRCLPGETRVRFPTNVVTRIPRDIPVGGAEPKWQPWLRARALARTIHQNLYYDGSGWANLDPTPGAAAWTLVEKPSSASAITPNILSPITTSVDMTEIRNRVAVTYHVPATKKTKAKKMSVVVSAAASHPLSAQSLAVNGVPWYSVEYYDEQDIHTQHDALVFARARLTEFLTEAVKIQVSTIPVWHLNPADLLNVQARDGAFLTRFQEGSVPLGPSGDAMTVGYQRFVRRPSAGLIRRR